MEAKKKCVQFLGEYYRELSFGNVNKYYRAMAGVESRKRLRRLTEENLKPIEEANEFSDIHAMLSKVCACLMRKEGNLSPGPAVEKWEKNYASMGESCKTLAGKGLEYLSGLPLEELGHMLKMQGICRYLLANSLGQAYQLFYISKTIKRGIRESVSQKPEEEYPGAGEIKRRFILHVRPTNSGKTHDVLERLKEYGHGAHFDPLRLLALEVYDKLNVERLPCSMIAGEKALEVPGSVCQPRTVETLNDHEYLDIVMVDECQMIADPYRGHSQTRVVLGLQVDEIYLYMASEAEGIVVQMIGRCGDQYRAAYHKRNTGLTMESKSYNLKRDLKRGDALIIFSKESVLALAAHLENERIHYGVIYGSPPPATRGEQVRRLLVKGIEVMAGADAIGMGLSLPIRRIVSVETKKFDSVNKHTLTPEKTRQIVGRVDKPGLYDEGFVSVIDESKVIRDGLSRLPIPIMKAYVGLPERLPNLPIGVDTLVKIRASTNTPSIYEKMEVGELLALYMMSEHVHQNDTEDFTRQEIYRSITCSINIGDKVVMGPWKDYCRDYREVEELEFPYSSEDNLYDLESYYKMLDLHFQFSRKVGLLVQTEGLAEERRRTEEEISRILKIECTGYSRERPACGKEPSWDYFFSVCGRCFERGKINRAHNRGGRRHPPGIVGRI